MIDSITTEFYWLILTITMTGLFWIPQIIHSIFKAGPITALLYPDEATKQYAEWAKRSKAAHNNAVENLIIFAPLTILVVILGTETDITAIAATVYFFARAVHFVMYIIAVPLMRTLMFLVGFACQMAMAINLLSII